MSYNSTMHYNDVIMSAMASQSTGVSIAFSTVGSGADQRKRQTSASLAFVRRIHRWPVNSPRKRPVTREIFHLMTLSCKYTHGALPSYFHTNNIKTQGAHHSRDTRHRNQLRTNIMRTNYAGNTLRNHLPALVNDAPLHILQIITNHSIHGFS